jgi:cell division protein FtsZ
VVLEPKAKKPAEAQSLPPQPEPAAGRFEPVPPPKSVRAPKRPLTYQDFPDFQNSGGGGETAANRNPAKPRGFFDWMAGRNKGGKSGPSAAAQKTVTLQPRVPQEKGQIEPEFNGHRNGFPARPPLQLNGDIFSEDGAAGQHNSQEATEIPDFFKKPLS